MPKLLRMLLVEDSVADAELASAALRKFADRVETKRVESADALVAALEQAPWDIVICDMRLPGFGGAQALEAVKSYNPFLPVLILSGGIGEDEAISLMRAGADDVLMKGNLGALMRTVERVLAQAEIRLSRTRFLRESENNLALLASIVDSADDAIVSKTTGGVILSWNKAATALFGYEPEEAIGQNITMLLPADRMDEEKVIVEQILRGERVEQFESRRRRKDGSLVDVSLTISPIKAADGRVIGASKIARDISARLAAERREERLTAYYAALSQTNQAIVRIREPETLYWKLCNICVQYGHAKMAYIALVVDGQVKPVAWDGPARDFLKRLNIPAPNGMPSGTGPIATAFRQGRHCICNDFLGDKNTLPWREAARALGTRATAAFPFRRGGKVVGVLSIHVEEKGFFTDELVALLDEMVGDLSFALDNIDRDAALQESVLRFQKVMENLQDGLIVSRLDGTNLEWNSAALEMSGYAGAHEAPGSVFELYQASELCFVDGRPVPAEQRPFARVLRGEKLRNWEARVGGTAGRERVFSFDGSIVHLSDDSSLAFVSMHDITERKRHETRIEYLATHDGLTDLPNRNLIHDRMEQAISHAKRSARQLAVMFIDLDRFKVINDGFGHPFGDALLRAVGERLGAHVREGDTVARQGGDEFLVLLADMRKSADAYIVVQKLLDAFDRPFTLEEREVHLTPSIGISIYPQDGADVETLIGNADIAMYRAKELGRNTYQFYTSQLSEATLHRVKIETDMRVAIDRQEMSLVYQPKVDLASGRIVGCEALLRWKHPTLGFVSPASFIPIAEESGLIVPIGEWVLRTACLQNKAWQRAGLPPIVVAVNLSARQFLAQDVSAQVREVLASAELDPAFLELELTESLIAHDTEKTIVTMNQLKEMGVELSIDDFGTGYSSLSYLRRFRVDALKIDQSFIRNVLTEPADASISLAVIALAHSLGLKVVAEGVETAEHCAFLAKHRCDSIQGYYFSRPVPPAEMAEMLRANKCLPPQTVLAAA